MTELLKDESLAEKLIKKGFWLYLFSFLIAPSGYIIRVIISNDLGVEEVGIIYSIISFISLISAYNDLGLTQTLQYYLPKFRIKKQHNFVKTAIFISLGFQIFTSIILGILLYFGADWLALHYFHTAEASEILKIFCFYFLGINLFQVLSSIFISFQDTFAQKIIEFSKMWSIVLFTIGFFLLGTGNLTNYSITWILGIIISIFIGVLIFIKKYLFTITKGNLEYDKDMIKKYGNYALWIFISINAGAFLGQIDQQMIIYFLGPKQAGYYSNFLSLIAISNIVIGPILIFLFPLISELINKKQTHKIYLLQNFLYKYFTVFSLSLGGIFMVLGPIISTILFGTKFIESGRLLSYSGIFIVISILYSINFNILAGMGKIKERVKILIIAAIFNFICNIILIPNIGIIGAIFSTIIGWGIIWLLSYKIINNYRKIDWDIKYIGKNILLISIFLVIIYFVKDNIFIYDNSLRYTNLMYLIVICIVYYLYLGLINWKDIKLLKDEIIKLKNN